jgi:hypothetical protein
MRIEEQLEVVAGPCNIFARAIGDVKALAKVKAGTVQARYRAGF